MPKNETKTAPAEPVETVVEEPPVVDSYTVAADPPADAEVVPEQPAPEPRYTARQDKSELVAAAIERGVPSYEAWPMTKDELVTKLEAD